MSDLNRFKIHLGESKKVRSAECHYETECCYEKIENCEISVEGKTVTVTILIRICKCKEKSKYVDHSELVNKTSFTTDQLVKLSDIAKHGVEIHLSAKCHYRQRFCQRWFFQNYYTLEKVDYCPSELPHHLK